MSIPYIVAIDQGTTSTRAAVYDGVRLEALAASQVELRQYFPHDGWVEHDPRQIWAAVATTVRQALAQAGVEPRQVVAVGITNQRETTLLWERSTGRPLARAIVWQDRRTAEFCRTRAADQPWLQARTGLLLDPYFSATKLQWLLDHLPGARTAAAAGQLAAGTVDTFLIWRLSGGAVHATDATNASRTLLFNIHTRQWDEELLRYFEVPAAVLPEVRWSTAGFGQTRGLDFLPDGIPICGVAGDQQAALYGQGCFAAGESKCTYGTGAFYLLHTGSRPVLSQHRLLTTLAAMTDPTPQYALEGAVFIAGAVVQWLRDGLKLIAQAGEVEQLVRQAADADEGVVFVPGFVGLGAPHWVPEARGAIFGLTRATTAADLARAALEGVAWQVADLVTAARRDWTEETFAALHVDGGMARNDWFLQRQADILDQEVVRAAQMEATAHGAAFLAAVGAGLADEPLLRQRVQTAGRFVPQWDEQRRRRRRERWQQAVAAVVRYAAAGTAAPA